IMLSNTREIRKRPPSYKRKTVGSTSRTTYVAKMNAEVTSRTSETRSVSVPTGIKTLNRRIIEGAGRANGGKVHYTRDCEPSHRLDLNYQAYCDENHLSGLSRYHAGGSACAGSAPPFLR